VPAAERYVRWYDHGFLRRYWSNLHKIAEGVYRSNYPNGRRFPEIQKLGIKSILNLRGGVGSVPHLLEQHYCDQFGIALHSVNLNARYAPDPNELLTLLDLFDRAEKPFLMHCKSGSDRAGLASALYLMHAEGKSLAEAQSMLSFKYLHVNDRKTGIMGHVLRAFGAAQAETGIGLRDWLSKCYDPEAEQAAFEASRKN
jgi:protein tyrosine/serine phosphatase